MSRPETVFQPGDDPVPNVFLDDSAPALDPHFGGGGTIGQQQFETLDDVRNGINDVAGLTRDDGLG